METGVTLFLEEKFQTGCNLRKLPHLFPSAKLGSRFQLTGGPRSSPVTAWYNYIIIATFEGLKQPLGLKQPQGLKPPLLVSGTAPVQCFENCFKLLLHQVSSQPVIQ